MERIREEILSNAEKLQSEVHEITIRLNNILQQNLKLSEHLKKLNYEELLSEKDQCLKITPCQHKTVHTLLLINLQLEELQTDLRSQLRELKCDSRETQSFLEFDKKKFENKTDKGPKISESSSISTLEKSVACTSSDSSVIMTSANSSFANVPLDSTVMEKLKKYDLLSRESRYLKNLPLPKIPNFKFKTVKVEKEDAKHQPKLNKIENDVMKPTKTEIPEMKIIDLVDLNFTENSSSGDNQTKINFAKENTKCSKPNKNNKTENGVVKPMKTESPKIKISNHLIDLNSTEKSSSTDNEIKISLTKENVANIEMKKTDMSVEAEMEIFKGILPSPIEPSVKTLCIISFVKHPSEFYINIIDGNLDEVEWISADFASNHDSPEALFLSKAAAKKNLSRFCLCYSEEDNFWNRAEIIDWLNFDEENVSIFFVDYGYSDYTSYKNIRPLLKKYAKVPQCAIKCHLAHLYPPDYTVRNQVCEWPDKTIQRLHEIIGPKNNCTYEIGYAKLYNDSWGIDLIKPSDRETTIGQMLLDENLCVESLHMEEIIDQLETGNKIRGISSDMSDSEKLERFSLTGALKEVKNPDQAVNGDKVDRGHKLLNSTPKHTPLTIDGYTIDKVKTHIEQTIPYKLPNVGEIVDIRITSISSLTLWYGHIISNLSTYSTLFENLNNPEKTDSYERLAAVPTPGDLVLARTHGFEDPWCRARVQEVYRNPTLPEEVAQLFLVDTGETVETGLADLRALPGELARAPCQAVACELAGLRQAAGGAPDEVAYCEATYLSKMFKAEVLEHAALGKLRVRLTKNAEDVAKRILEDGYGQADEDEVCSNFF